MIDGVNDTNWSLLAEYLGVVTHRWRLSDFTNTAAFNPTSRAYVIAIASQRSRSLRYIRPWGESNQSKVPCYFS